MLTELFTVTGWTFWLLLAAAMIIELALVASAEHRDSHGFATFVAMAALIGAILFTDAFAGARLLMTLTLIAGYLFAGVAWSFWEWWAFLIRKREEYRSDWERGLKEKTFQDYLQSRRPLAADNKQRIVSWMVLWPFYAGWWAMTWPRRFFVWVYERLSTVFDRITDRIFSG